MAADPRVVAAALVGTSLEGREVKAVPVLDTDETGFEVDIEGLEPRPSWSAARSVCEPLGLWPVFGCARTGDTYSRSAFPNTGDYRPRAILERAAEIVWPAAVPRDGWGDRWAEILRMEVQQTRKRVGDAPDPDELLRRFPHSDDRPALERLLLEWEEKRRPTERHGVTDHFDEDFVQYAWPAIALLPSADPWAVPAYVHFWGARPPEEFVSALRSWHRRYGAETWAADGCTMQLMVERPIQDLSEALTVATELSPFYKWDDSLRALARALYKSRFWEIYDRP